MEEIRIFHTRALMPVTIFCFCSVFFRSKLIDTHWRISTKRKKKKKVLTTLNKISLHRMDRLFVNAKTAVMPGFENDSVYVEEGTVVIVFNPAISNHVLFLTRWIPETSYDINKSQLVFTCGFFFLWGIFWLLKWIFICPTFSWNK